MVEKTRWQGNNFRGSGVSNPIASRYCWRNPLAACATIYTFSMLRTALLFFCMLGFFTSELYAAPAAASSSRPIHRRKPMAGNYRPVYRYYRGHSNQKSGFFGLFQHKSAAQRNAGHSRKPQQKSRVHRGTL